MNSKIDKYSISITLVVSVRKGNKTFNLSSTAFVATINFVSKYNISERGM